MSALRSSDQLAELDSGKTGRSAEAETSLRSLLHFAFQVSSQCVAVVFQENKAVEPISMTSGASYEMTGIRHMPMFTDLSTNYHKS
jgi:hypothetical protein